MLDLSKSYWFILLPERQSEVVRIETINKTFARHQTAFRGGTGPLQGLIGSMPRKFDLLNRRENRGKWGKMGENGGQKNQRKNRGQTSPTNFAHVNTNLPTILGGTLGHLVLGKSLTCDKAWDQVGWQ